jgi:hypothetical protein
VFVRDWDLELQELDVKLVATDEGSIRQILRAITPTESNIWNDIFVSDWDLTQMEIGTTDGDIMCPAPNFIFYSPASKSQRDELDRFNPLPG